MLPTNLTLRQQDEIADLINKHVTANAVDVSVPCFRIKWRGKIIETITGKSRFRTIGAAKTAFNNHLRRQYAMAQEYYRIVNNLSGPGPSWGTRDFVNAMRDEATVEFIQVP